jgi:6-phosphogluconolactonase (cycloisomerase 2 family)
VGSELSGDIWVYQINSATGVLTATAGSPFTATGLSISDEMTVDATGQFLYVAQTDSTLGIAGFTINQSTGALTSLGLPFPLGVAQIHASPTAGLLLGVQEVADGTTSATDKHVYVFSINSGTGVPTAVTGSPFSTATGNAPFDFVISPNGRYVYALEANPVSNSDAPIEGFTLDASTGSLASLGTFSGVPAAEACRIDQSGVALFCSDTLFGSTMTVNSVNPSTGAVSHVADLAVSSGTPLAVTD